MSTLTAWTLIIFLIYNPGDGGMPLLRSERVEFFGQAECRKAVSTAQSRMAAQFKSATAVCVERSPAGEAGVNTWTSLTFVAFNPGGNIPPAAGEHRIEFFTQLQCERGSVAIEAALKRVPGIIRVSPICFGREDDTKNQ